jgi:hypothetical protein
MKEWPSDDASKEFDETSLVDISPSAVDLLIYSALVIVSVNAQQRGFSWPIKARRFYVLHYYPHAAGRLDDNYGVSVTAFLLVWALAGLILGILRILASSPPIAKGLRPFGGITAVAGFPRRRFM